MLNTRNILLIIAVLIVLPFLFPRTIGNLAAEVHSAYNETMRERGAEAYRRRNP